MIHFADKWALLLLLPLAGIAYLHLKKKPKSAAIRFSDVKILKEIKPTISHKIRQALPLMRILGIAILVLGFARPQSSQKLEEFLTEGIDIVLCIDISGSMKAEDFKPKNRLQVAKEAAADFIRSRTNDRIGMVVFARRAYTQCPLTLDYGILLNFLESVEIGQIEDGTAIGMAIATSVNRLRDIPSKSKVIILLTDGSNNAGEIDPLTAAKAAKAMGVKIYTIGAGKQNRVPYPIDDPIFGRRYQLMDFPIEEGVLRQIAGETGGKYFRATDEQGLKQIYREISEMEKTKIEVKEYTRYTELFPYFIFPGFAIILIELFLSNTRFRKVP